MNQLDRHSGRVAGKVAIVTGAGAKGAVAGVGQAIAELLAREGAAVAVLDRDAAAADRTVEAITARGGSAVPILVDVADEDACREAIGEVVHTLGGLDILVNNAAINNNASGRSRITEVNVEEWRRIFAVNVDGPLFMTKHGIPAMQGSGSIVAISTLGVVQPGADCAYNSSKGALERLTLVTAMDYGKEGIRANCVRPGAIWSELMSDQYPDDEARAVVRAQRANLGALQSEGTSWDIAQAALYLASDEARWVTGQVFNIDAGWASMADHGFMRQMKH